MSQELETRRLLAQTTILVQDINISGAPSSIGNLTNVNGILYYTANDGTNGYELWKSDGTSSGTVLVKDIRPGSDSSGPRYLTNVNGVLYFHALDETNGFELWKSDGTSSGTVLVKDIRPGSSHSSPLFLTNVSGVLYFNANDGTNGYELWKSDGTSSGTVMVKDILPGNLSSQSRYLTNVSGVLYFRASDGTNGHELWKSDGTSSGTVMVKDISPGGSHSLPNNLANVGGILYFNASDGPSGYELWKSDGTSSGTVMVKDIRLGGSHSLPNNLANVGGVLYFRALDVTNGYELWKSDGTSSGTVMVNDIRPGFNGSSPRYLTNVNGVLYFCADDGTNGGELWKSDGTSSGTIVVKDIRSGRVGSYPFHLTNVGGVLYFCANGGTSGGELWKSDGTSSGTVMVKDIRPGSDPSSPHYLTNVNGVLYFYANNGTNGYELWKSDGTSSGTVMVKDIYAGSTSSSPRHLTNVNGVLYFNACDGTNGFELWKSDGTSSGTVMVKDISPGRYWSSPHYLTNVNGVLYFSAGDGTNGDELWKSDGTSSGTVMVKDINLGGASSSPRQLTNVGGVLYFCAFDGTNGGELWKTDGTSFGTVPVKDIRPGRYSSHPRYLTNVGGVLYFAADDVTHGLELWKSDGTSSGTVMVKDIAPGSFSPFLGYLTNVGGVLYFCANGGTSGGELWKSDGTSFGTVMVKDIRPGGSWSFPSHLTNVNGVLYFSATDGTNGGELWKSDGTSSGTVMVNDISPGSDGSGPRYLANVGGVLYFSAYDVTHGRELHEVIEIPSISINDISVNESSATATFTVTLSNTPVQTVTVDWATSNGTAVSPGDYAAGSGALTFAAGQTSKTISVNIVNDTLYEANETFSVLLSNPGNATFSDSTGVATIVDDDPAQSLSINDISVNESSTTATFTVTLSIASAQTVTLNWATANGTAVSPNDYGVASGTLTFSPGQTSKTISVNIVNDTLDEANETFSVVLSNVTNAALGDSTGVATIIDNDPAPTLKIADPAKIVEGHSGSKTMSFTVTLSKASGQPVTVSYSTADNLAVSGSDYAAASGVLTFAPGQLSQAIIVVINGDTTIEPDETFFVNLTNLVNATFTDAQAVGTIANDEFSIAISDVTQTEGNSGPTPFAFTVSLSQAAPFPVTVKYLTANGTATAASGDFTAIPATTLTFNPGETSKVVTVNVNGDSTIEADETFSVSLNTSTNAAIADPSGVGKILNDDVSISISNVTALETAGTFNFTVSLSAPSTSAITVKYATADGTAVASGDYTAKALTTLTIPAGSTSANATVTVKNDFVVESNETFFVNLSSPTNAIIADSQAVGTITDEDVSISIGDVTASESAGTFNFTVSLSAPYSLPVTVKYATANGSAVAPGDYTAKAATTLTIPAGSTSATATVTIINDAVVESNETFFVNLSSPTNATIADNQAVGTILDNDGSPLLLDSGSARKIYSAPALTPDALKPVVDVAKGIWALQGFSTEQLSILDQISWRIANLRGRELGRAFGNAIVIDTNAAGQGWFVDQTPTDSSEFFLGRNRLAPNRVDLLTVVTHEIGHMLGLDHDDHGVMAESLKPGVRQISIHEHETATRRQANLAAVGSAQLFKRRITSPLALHQSPSPVETASQQRLRRRAVVTR